MKRNASIAATGTVADFDFSDVTPPGDTLDDILAVAAEVLAEYGEEKTPTRIRRLAEYVALTLGGEPHQTEALGHDGCERYRVHPTAYPLIRAGTCFAVENAVNEDKTCTPIAVGTEAARAFAVAMLRACESAE